MANELDILTDTCYQIPMLFWIHQIVIAATFLLIWNLRMII